MTSTEAPEGVAFLTDRFGVTGKTALKPASGALNVTAAGFDLPHPASSPPASTSARNTPIPLVMAGRLRQVAARAPAAPQKIAPRHPPASLGLDLLEGERAVTR